jgi:hypothetical protein
MHEWNVTDDWGHPLGSSSIGDSPGVRALLTSSSDSDDVFSGEWCVFFFRYDQIH